MRVFLRFAAVAALCLMLAPRASAQFDLWFPSIGYETGVRPYWQNGFNVQLQTNHNDIKRNCSGCGPPRSCR